MISFSKLGSEPIQIEVAGAPDGVDALVVAQLVDACRNPVLVVLRDETRMQQLAERLAFVAPAVPLLALPAWDCLPYDRVSPNAASVADRLDALICLAEGVSGQIVVLTTISSVLQKVPPVQSLQESTLHAKLGERCPIDALQSFFERNGYRRANTVREAGEYTVRGGIVDVFPPGTEDPLRLDFFGDELESIRRFDAMSQRTLSPQTELILRPVSEIMLDKPHIDRFRQAYREQFGGDTSDDPLFATVSEGRRAPGLEHWMPLFHAGMETLFDWLPKAPIVLDSQAEEAIAARLDLIQDHYEARRENFVVRSKKRGAVEDGDAIPVYKPIPPALLYLNDAAWNGIRNARRVFALNAFPPSDLTGDGTILDTGIRRVTDFAAARKDPNTDLFQAVAARIRATAPDRTLIAVSSEGARDRLKLLLREGGVEGLVDLDSWSTLTTLPEGACAIAVMPVDGGFEGDGVLVLSEQDILGERIGRPARRRRGEEFITELSAIESGDLVVHVDHGIGRYDGLETVMVDQAPHDCLRILYAGGDRLFLPVENLEVLSRYGSEDAHVQLDKLGGVAWQARKARLKERVRQIADELLKIAAERELRKDDKLFPPDGAFEEFCARFPYSETEDQLRAIEDAVADLGSGKAMDRLICGDVGFGKTEVALRAAFIAALSGRQVAVVVPTTLLARQHYRVFKERFTGLPIKVAQLSRLVAGREAVAIKDGLSDGAVDIAVGTHALLSKSIKFRDLGLLVIDEEQHFGVQQKERLKKLRANVHVLTLTATPIPRTLQMALSGVREMSIIASPPVDRLAVRTFVLPSDPVVLREAIRRERYRGGQIFYVCPRITDLDRTRERILELTPNASVAVAHGQMQPAELERTMTDFVAGKYDILLSTNIVESGLDIPNANTMIVHRADMFGLSQLYQLRGRIGRGKQRAYCYLMLPPGKVLTPMARKRLEVMQTLDSLGAGFTLASHDLDIRGAGNLLGEEQSGHIKEVGVELYQRMLVEAVATARDHIAADDVEETWTPTINVGIAVLIPERYVPDLSVRLGLYRRLSDLKDSREIDQFAVEIVDRFGPLPEEVENLLQVVAIKQACKAAGIAKMEAGPRGAVITFRNDVFANPPGLVGFIQKMAGTTKLRPDHKMVVRRPWTEPERRLTGVKKVADALAKIAA